mmetsp:Transcript_20852/g.40309  ORF Transcript_20852/g.40309 Transcript_20852/m.40309 type:complete len:360 (+) Transcript_20852:527-1606(+)
MHVEGIREAHVAERGVAGRAVHADLCRPGVAADRGLAILVAELEFKILEARWLALLLEVAMLAALQLLVLADRAERVLGVRALVIVVVDAAVVSEDLRGRAHLALLARPAPGGVRVVAVAVAVVVPVVAEHVPLARLGVLEQRRLREGPPARLARQEAVLVRLQGPRVELQHFGLLQLAAVESPPVPRRGQRQGAAVVRVLLELAQDEDALALLDVRAQAGAAVVVSAEVAHDGRGAGGEPLEHDAAGLVAAVVVARRSAGRHGGRAAKGEEQLRRLLAVARHEDLVVGLRARQLVALDRLLVELLAAVAARLPRELAVDGERSPVVLLDRLGVPLHGAVLPRAQVRLGRGRQPSAVGG